MQTAYTGVVLFISRMKLNYFQIISKSYSETKFIYLSNYLYEGTDEEQIIQLLVDHSNDQRQEIKTQFATMFGQVCLSLKLYYH